MKLLSFLFGVVFLATSVSAAIVLMRHAEKEHSGDNLSCQGLNRALELPLLLEAKFGRFEEVFVPRPLLGRRTQRIRMLQTITPLCTRFNLSINSDFEEDQIRDLADDLKGKKGMRLVVWEQHTLPEIVRALGIAEKKHWDPNDFDTLWVVIFVKNQTQTALSVLSQGLNNRSEVCV